MLNPLVEMIEEELNQLGINNMELLMESYSPKSFGDAEAIYKFGNFQLSFSRTRDDVTVNFSAISSPQSFYNIEDVAVLLGWITLDEILAYGMPINFDEPPPGPIFNLKKALTFIKKDIEKLDKAFSLNELVSTVARLKNIEQKRMRMWNPTREE